MQQPVTVGGLILDDKNVLFETEIIVRQVSNGKQGMVALWSC